MLWNCIGHYAMEYVAMEFFDYIIQTQELYGLR